MMGMFNLAQPPFDDVHVRRAVNYVLDRAAIVKALGGVSVGDPAYRMLPPALAGEDDGDPTYETTSPEERLEAAREEMRQSAYDPDGTGSCSAPECKKASVINLYGTSPMSTLIKDNLAEIGIDADLPNYEVDTAFAKCADPKQHVGLCTQLTLGSSTPSGAGIAEVLGSGNIEGCCDLPLFGATPEQLAGWGYETTDLPSVDDKLAECSAALGDEASPAGRRSTTTCPTRPRRSSRSCSRSSRTSSPTACATTPTTCSASSRSTPWPWRASALSARC